MPKNAVDSDLINRNEETGQSVQRDAGEILVSLWIESRRMSAIFSNSEDSSRKKFAPAVIPSITENDKYARKYIRWRLEILVGLSELDGPYQSHREVHNQARKSRAVAPMELK